VTANVPTAAQLIAQLHKFQPTCNDTLRHFGPPISIFLLALSAPKADLGGHCNPRPVSIPSVIFTSCRHLSDKSHYRTKLDSMCRYPRPESAKLCHGLVALAHRRDVWDFWLVVVCHFVLETAVPLWQ
jgi:hypothetical protein